jgi:streptogramin lyase
MIEFPIPTSNSGPFNVALGPDGNVWFTEVNGNNIGEITPAGIIGEFPVSGSPGGIIAGPDGAIWFTEIGGNKIGRMNISDHMVQEFLIPTGGAFAHEITTGPDGALWFAEAGADKIGRITTAGSVTEYALPTVGSTPFDITSGPDGHLWFTEIGGNRIGEITTAGVITAEFSVAGSPAFITAGPDGALWFTEVAGNKIGRITTDGHITEFMVPTANSQPQGITTGPDHALWFTEANGDKIGRVTTDGDFSEFAIPTASSNPFGIVTGSDGNLSFAEFSGNKIGEASAPPVLTAAFSNVSASAGQMLPVGNLFSATDADNDILSYTLYDATPTANSGHFMVNGQVVPAQNAYQVTQAQLAQTTFVAGASGTSADLFVIASDGEAFSNSGNWTEFHVNVAANQPPVLTAAFSNVSASAGQMLPAGNLFSATDADNDPLTYTLYDATPTANSGHFMVNGQVVPAQNAYQVTQAQLAQTTFVAGASGTSADLFVIASDGQAFSNSGNWTEFHVNVAANQAPVLTVASSNVTASAGQMLPASSLFSATDADNDPLTYTLYDATTAANSGHFMVNGQVVPAQNAYQVTQAQLAQTTFVAGASGTSADLFVIASDGQAFSNSGHWSEFHVFA